MRLSNFIDRSGVMYSVEREGKIVGSYKGLINTEQSSGKRYVAFYPDADVQISDFITNPYGDRYYVSNRETQTFAGSPMQLKCDILTFAEYQSSKTQSTTFHIENAYGSVIGTQANVTLHYNDSIQQAKHQIESSDSPDKQELQQIISLLRTTCFS